MWAVEPDRKNDLAGLVRSVLLHLWAPVIAVGLVVNVRQGADLGDAVWTAIILALVYWSGRRAAKQ